ncbi:hypothetical protein FRC09_003676 [Ceratobasidium sp. 395]|nr:hypothetical protein FRC09_003676 [Ceratobasidium sp. 395]
MPTAVSGGVSSDEPGTHTPSDAKSKLRTLSQSSKRKVVDEDLGDVNGEDEDNRPNSTSKPKASSSHS